MISVVTDAIVDVELSDRVLVVGGFQELIDILVVSGFLLHFNSLISEASLTDFFTFPRLIRSTNLHRKCSPLPFKCQTQ